jgi:protein-L-isoaspartate O-methyltransferase
MTYADGNLYLRFSDGIMALAEANSKEYVEKGTFVIPDHDDALGATAPVIAGGRMYLRDDNRLFCYQLRTDVASAKPPRIVQVTIEKDEILDTQHKRVGPRSVFVPTPHDVVEKMLTMASVRKQDTVYDLGSGDGRIVITAAKQYGSRAVGIEIDRELVEISQAKAEQAGVASKATFQRRDIFTADVSAADVIVLYLLPNQLERLLPQLQKLKDGTRIVSHQFAIPGIEPDKVLEVESQDDGETHKLFLWTAPLKSLHK